MLYFAGLKMKWEKVRYDVKALITTNKFYTAPSEMMCHEQLLVEPF